MVNTGVVELRPDFSATNYLEVCHGNNTEQHSALLLARSRSSSSSTTCRPFEITSKRRKGYPSETNVKKGVRVVHGHKELLEKLGRRDPCPCGSARAFKNCCMKRGRYDGALRGHFFQGEGLMHRAGVLHGAPAL